MPTPTELGFFAPDECKIDRPVLRDPALQAQLEQRGYVVVPFLDAAQVQYLTDGYDDIAADLGGSSDPADYNDTYAEFSIIHSRPEFRRRAYALVDQVLTPIAAKHLQDYQPVIANFVNKPPGTGVVPTHQNFSVSDETRFRSVSVWVALVDCTVGNGAMSMLDGSHQTLRGRRGMWAYQAWTGIPQPDMDAYLTAVEVPAGSAVILDDAILHYSPPNTTDQRRLAIQFVMVPEEVSPRWFQQTGTSEDGLEVSVWEVDERYFFEFWHGDGDNDYATLTDRVTIPAPCLDLASLEGLIGTAPTPRRMGRLRSQMSQYLRQKS